MIDLYNKCFIISIWDHGVDNRPQFHRRDLLLEDNLYPQ